MTVFLRAFGLSVIALCFVDGANGAEPYLSVPKEIAASCQKPPVQIPNGVLSLFYPSDECGVIFIGPPSKLKASIASNFPGVSMAECKAIQSLLEQQAKLKDYRSQVSQKIIEGKLSAAQIVEEKAKIEAASEIVSEGLTDDYNTFGSKSVVAIQQDWQANVQQYSAENPEYTVYPLYSSAGILTFEEKIIPATYEQFGLYENKSESPYIEYTISGMPPLGVDSPLLDEGKLPIFFPTARVDRANLKSIEFGGGGISASVTLNRAGYCKFALNGDANLSSAFTPTVTYAMALKTSGEYRVDVKVDYLMGVLNSLQKSTTGTASALAVADDFYMNRGSNTIDVVLDNDLKNSLSPAQSDAFVQTVLIDVANQFLTSITGVAGAKKDVQLPAVADVEKYKTIQQWQRVCHRSGGFLGIGGSSHCYDQAYNVKVLQDTAQFQSASQIVSGNFIGGGATKIRSYILVPWNASL